MFAGINFLITLGSTEAIVIATAEKLLNFFVHIQINRQNSNSGKKCLEAQEKKLVLDLKKQKQKKPKPAQTTLFFSTATQPLAGNLSCLQNENALPILSLFITISACFRGCCVVESLLSAVSSCALSTHTQRYGGTGQTRSLKVPSN